jgi:Pentapeptide repeats (8 copies)
MANQKQLDILTQGVEAWNQWRKEYPDIQPDLSFADLSRADLRGADLSRADLRGATLERATLLRATLVGANLMSANLILANLSGANLEGATLVGAELAEATLVDANLSGADLSLTTLSGANLSGADLSLANLNRARLDRTNLTRATLTACSIYGISAWSVQLEGTIQNSLVITAEDEPVITVDNLEVAQFIYLLLNNKKIRDVIDTITSKVVLILGRFTPERKVILDALTDELRLHNYLPILFDFEKPVSRDFTETISTLAHLARFIIADLTEPSSIPQELQKIVPGLEVPVQPILEEGKKEYALFFDLSKYPWVFPVHRYKDQASLIASLKKEVLEPADEKARKLNVMKAKRLEKR